MTKRMANYLNRLDEFIDVQFQNCDAEYTDFSRVKYYITFVEKNVKHINDSMLRYLITNLEFDKNKQQFLEKIMIYIELNKDFIREYLQLFEKIVEDSKFTVFVIPLEIRNMNLIKQIIL